MKTGVVQSYNAAKGYGFIRPSGGEKDLFVHVTELESKAIGLQIGDEVSFDTSRGTKGEAAIRVKVLRRTQTDGGQGTARPTQAEHYAQRRD